MLQVIETISASRYKMLGGKATTPSRLGKETLGAVKGDCSHTHLRVCDLKYFLSTRGQYEIMRACRAQWERECRQAFHQEVLDVRSHMVEDLIEKIIGDLYEEHKDAGEYSYGEVRNLFNGYKSQALRQAATAQGFEAYLYRKLAKAFEDKTRIRRWLGLSRVVLREKPML